MQQTYCPDCGGPKYRYAVYCKNCKAKGERNAMYGRTQSTETRSKIAARRLGRPLPERQAEGHPLWKGDAVGKQSGRERATRWYPHQPCAVCGAEKTERHHIDGNTRHNTPDNVVFLCRPHHRQIHPGNGREPLRPYTGPRNARLAAERLRQGTLGLEL